MPADPGQEQPPSPIAPIAGRATPESKSQTEPHNKINQLFYENEKLKAKILELKRGLECSEERQMAMGDRLKAAETELTIKEQRLLRVENLLFELLEKLERAPIGGAMLSSVVDSGPAQPASYVDVLNNAVNTLAAANSGVSTCYPGSSQSVSFESYLSTEMAYSPVDPLLASHFLTL